MKYLLFLFLLCQNLAANGQEVDTMLFRQLEENLQKAGDSVIAGYILWENCEFGKTWLDFQENKMKSDALVQFLESHPAWKIEIAKHTDCRGHRIQSSILTANRRAGEKLSYKQRN